jgi:hypothetical protein
MFTTIIIDNVTKIAPLLNQECVTLKLFGLSTKILAADVAIFMIGLIITIILAELLANYMVANIEDQKKRKMKELYLKKRKEKTLKPKIIQCDKCYNEYSETEITKCNIIGHICQQYCTNCTKQSIKQGDNKQSIKKSQSDYKINYNYTISTNK